SVGNFKMIEMDHHVIWQGVANLNNCVARMLAVLTIFNALISHGCPIERNCPTVLNPSHELFYVLIVQLSLECSLWKRPMRFRRLSRLACGQNERFRTGPLEWRLAIRLNRCALLLW